MIARVVFLVALASAVAVSGPPEVLAQDEVGTLAAACAAGDPESLTSPCLESALAVRAVQGLVGLAATGGASLQGSSSTLGKRFGGTPRLAIGAGLVLAHGDLPGVLAPANGVAPSKGVLLVAFQTTASAGLFNGFSTAPTVGGILALDAFATFSHVRAPDHLGFDDSASGFGLGARVGILRESFTLPGITLSIARRWMGTTDLSGSNGSRADVEVTATSVRLTAGKEFLAFGLLGGVGWDRYGGAVGLEARPSGPEGPFGKAGKSSFETDRMLLFGGLGYTFLIAQVGVEGGWAAGQKAPAGRSGDGFDPATGSLFARVSFRLTL